MNKDSSLKIKDPIVVLIGEAFVFIVVIGGLLVAAAIVRLIWESIKLGWTWGGVF